MNIFQPKTEADVAQVIRETNQGLSIFGGGTRGVCERGVNSLETTGLSGIIDYQPGALTMIAQAGTPLKEIAETLGQEGLDVVIDNDNTEFHYFGRLCS